MSHRDNARGPGRAHQCAWIPPHSTNATCSEDLGTGFVPAVLPLQTPYANPLQRLTKGTTSGVDSYNTDTFCPLWTNLRVEFAPFLAPHGRDGRVTTLDLPARCSTLTAPWWCRKGCILVQEIYSRKTTLCGSHNHHPAAHTDYLVESSRGEEVLAAVKKARAIAKNPQGLRVLPSGFGLLSPCEQAALLRCLTVPALTVTPMDLFEPPTNVAEGNHSILQEALFGIRPTSMPEQQPATVPEPITPQFGATPLLPWMGYLLLKSLLLKEVSVVGWHRRHSINYCRGGIFGRLQLWTNQLVAEHLKDRPVTFCCGVAGDLSSVLPNDEQLQVNKQKSGERYKLLNRLDAKSAKPPLPELAKGSLVCGTGETEDAASSPNGSDENRSAWESLNGSAVGTGGTGAARIVGCWGRGGAGRGGGCLLFLGAAQDWDSLALVVVLHLLDAVPQMVHSQMGLSQAASKSDLGMEAHLVYNTGLVGRRLGTKSGSTTFMRRGAGLGGDAIVQQGGWVCAYILSVSATVVALDWAVIDSGMGACCGSDVLFCRMANCASCSIGWHPSVTLAGGSNKSTGVMVGAGMRGLRGDGYGNRTVLSCGGRFPCNRLQTSRHHQGAVRVELLADKSNPPGVYLVSWLYHPSHVVQGTEAINKYNPLNGASYIDLPEEIKNKKLCINVKNEDQKCFLWAIKSAQFPAEKDTQRVTKYKNVGLNIDKELDKYPTKIHDIPNRKSN
ncbi:hypothetical protein PR048_026545 [Dryococelus australis]|uniref:Uncharacterized protein n=1 Tax=Dryococelus australis TaxID=614101 RepID=A0ABQ9GLL4_9NEOP|nr:hypothetical protein PR048_026545 [Dryococelus australis]